MLFFDQLIHLFIICGGISGQTSNQTEDYDLDYNDDDDNPLYYKPVINVKVELPTIATKDLEYDTKDVMLRVTSAMASTVVVVATNCGLLCQTIKFDSITSLTFTKNSSQEMVILFRDNCFWIIDIKMNSSRSQYGREHPFIFNTIEASFALPVSDNQMNVMAIFTSGLSSQSFLFKDFTFTELAKTIHSFPGLSVDTTIPIDDSFIWFESKTLYFFQMSHYFAYDLTKKRQFSGYPRNVTDFGLSSKQSIDSVTVIQKQIHFFTENYFAIYSVEKRNNESAVFSGHLSEFMPFHKLFLKCPKMWISLRALDTNSSNDFLNKSRVDSVSDDEDDPETKQMPTALILTLTLLFIFLIIASIILVFVLIKNNSIKRELNKSEEPVPQLKEVKEDPIQRKDDLKEKPKELEDKDLVNRISVYSSGKSVSTNAVINVKI